MNDEYHTAERLQLLAGGYHILPNLDKKCLRPGWAELDYVENELQDNAKRTAAERVARWPGIYQNYRATGVRLEDGLAVIDSDVDDDAGAGAMFDIVKTIVPEIEARAPTRYGSGEKFALFCRTDKPFGRTVSRSWIKPGSDAVQRVEIFGGKKTPKGKCARQFGIYGPHSHNDDGTVKLHYSWDEGRPALHDIALKDLLLLTEKQADQICDAFDAWAEAAGWERVKEPETAAGTFVFDITEETRFDTDRAGVGLTYEELSEAHDTYSELRCSTSFLGAGRGARRVDHCRTLFSQRYQCVGVWVFGDEAMHLPVEAKPPDTQEFGKLLAEVVPAETTGNDAQPAAPDDKAPLADKLAYLLTTYAYCAMTDTVVRLHEPNDDCQMRMIGFQRHFRAWFEETTGPRNGVQRSYATAAWELSAARMNVRGVRMRPDQPFPIYAEDGEWYKNTYRHPVHNGTGNIALWVAFMEHLLPNPVERAWFEKRLAHKWRYPWIPGVGTVMVAANDAGSVQGCGRGLLSDIIARLFGRAYVRPVSFDILTGASSQGAYTDWAAYSTWISVDEAKDTPDSGRWSARRASYERLKELVDPRVTMRTFTGKHIKAFLAYSFASYLIATNNRDALQLTGDDRRFTVLSNGKKMPDEMRVALAAWMEQPGNIAELASYLETIDLTGFDVYQPLHTQAKGVMQELARSEVDEALAVIRKIAGPNALFTGEAVREAILAEVSGSEHPDENTKRTVRRIVRAHTRRVQEFRTAPSAGRYWILTWRDADTSHVVDSSTANTMAASIDRRIRERYESTFTGDVVGMGSARTGDVDTVKDE